MPESESYQTALRQIDELISHLRQNQSADCAAAEAEDAVLIRLADWKTDLKPEHHAAIAQIGRYYRQFCCAGRKSMSIDIKPGIYRHYKGNLYEVAGMARHSETEEVLVVYRALYGSYGLWVRPAEMFAETVEYEGKSVPRFACIKVF